MKEKCYSSESRKTIAARLISVAVAVMLMLAMMPLAGDAARADDGTAADDKIIKNIDLEHKIPECGDIGERDGESTEPEFVLPENADYEIAGKSFWYGNGIGKSDSNSNTDNQTGNDKDNQSGSNNQTGNDKDNQSGSNTETGTEETSTGETSTGETSTEGTSTEEASKEVAFEGGKKYIACILLKAKEEFEFDLDTENTKAMFKGTVNLNGETVTPKLTKYYPDNGQILAVAVTVNIEHKYGEPEIIKPSTTLRNGTVKYTCSACGASKSGTAPLAVPVNHGKDGTSYGKGADGMMMHNSMVAYKSNNDPKGTMIAPLLLKATKTEKNSIYLSWSGVNGVAAYRLYGNKSGKSNTMKYLGETTAKNVKVEKIEKKLKKKTYYKFIVVALDKEDRVITCSKMIHAATKGSEKITNYKSVVVKKRKVKWGWYETWVKTGKIKLKKGKSQKIKVEQIKKIKKGKVKQYIPLRVVSSNPKVATATKKKIKAKKKGKCTIYFYAQNGMVKKVKVTVKK